MVTQLSQAYIRSDNDDDFEMIDAYSPFVVNINKFEERELESTFPQLADLMLEQGKKAQGPTFHALSDNKEREQLWKLFKSKLSAPVRKDMNCRACEDFVRQYGDLCCVDDNGDLVPLSWSLDLTEVPADYKESVKCVAESFKGEAVSEELVLEFGHSKCLGHPVTGKWKHMSIVLEKARLANKISNLDAQDTNTGYAMLERVLSDNSNEVIQRAHHLIHEDQLPYATAHKATISFLKDRAEKLKNVDDRVQRKNLITRYSREAFVGCLSSLRAGMVGVLLASVAAGDSFEETERLWKAKANPTQYLRPTAAPSVGNIESAEKIFAKLGYTPSDLARVFLTLDQVPRQAIMWSPSSDEEVNKSKAASPKPKLFGSLLSSRHKQNIPFTKAPIKDCTFRHFAAKVLPTAKTLSVLPDSFIQPYFFTTGKEGSKPIMSFHQDGGHTASWYTWGATKRVQQASLTADWTPVTSIVTFPHMFDHFETLMDVFDSEKVEAFKHNRHGIRILFCLEGAREQGDSGLGLFPTLMKSEFHSVRSTVEAFSTKGKVEFPSEGALAGGLAVESDGRSSMIVGVVTREGQISKYRITLFE